MKAREDALDAELRRQLERVEYCECGAELDGFGSCPECDYDGDTYDPERTCQCGYSSAVEVCGCCGSPLCHQCFECGGGFCKSCPTEAWMREQEADR